ARPGRSRLVVLHVADTTMTGVYGADTADLHTESDRRYLADVVATLKGLGHDARPVLLYGPDRAARLVAELQESPVDLLVGGSHGHGLVRALLFGETVESLRHGLSIPMLIARPDQATRNGEAQALTDRE